MNQQTQSATDSPIRVINSRTIHTVEWKPYLDRGYTTPWHLIQTQMGVRMPIYIKGLHTIAYDEENEVKGYLDLITSQYRQDDRPDEAANYVLKHISDTHSVGITANITVVGKTNVLGRIEFNLQIDGNGKRNHVSTAIRFALWIFEALKIMRGTPAAGLIALRTCKAFSRTEFRLAKDNDRTEYWVSEERYELYRNGLCCVEDLLADI